MQLLTITALIIIASSPSIAASDALYSDYYPSFLIPNPQSDPPKDTPQTIRFNPCGSLVIESSLYIAKSSYTHDAWTIIAKHHKSKIWYSLEYQYGSTAIADTLRKDETILQEVTQADCARLLQAWKLLCGSGKRLNGLEVTIGNTRGTLSLDVSASTVTFVTKHITTDFFLYFIKEWPKDMPVTPVTLGLVAPEPYLPSAPPPLLSLSRSASCTSICSTESRTGCERRRMMAAPTVEYDGDRTAH
jgi:hypothetical protein